MMSRQTKFLVREVVFSERQENREADAGLGVGGADLAMVQVDQHLCEAEAHS